MSVCVLGDQLTRSHRPLVDRPAEPVLVVESPFSRRLSSHHRLTPVFSAMRHFHDELRDAGREVAYYRTEIFHERGET